VRAQALDEPLIAKAVVDDDEGVVVGDPGELLEHLAGLLFAVVQDHHHRDPVALFDSSPEALVHLASLALWKNPLKRPCRLVWIEGRRRYRIHLPHRPDLSVV